MDTLEIKNIVNQYFDNELSKAEEVILFTQLANDITARDYFKEMNSLRTVMESADKEYPSDLDEKIFTQIKRNKPKVQFVINRKKIFEAVSLGFAVVLLIISIFFYNESLQFKNQLEITSQQVKQQNQLIQVLYNTLPQAEVVQKVENEIIVTSQM